MAVQSITLRGVRVHNLQSVDLEIPHRELVVVCGVSGSGKTSLALDTLYAEGQRRYIESFSAYTRQFLERLDKPDADRIDGIPPSIAVTHRPPARSSRATIGTATETHEYLRLLFARVGSVVCYGCGQSIHRDSAESAADLLVALPEGARYIVSFKAKTDADESIRDLIADLRADGYVRAIAANQTRTLDDLLEANGDLSSLDQDLQIVVDRLTTGMPVQRIRDSLETALRHGDGKCDVFVSHPAPPTTASPTADPPKNGNGQSHENSNQSRPTDSDHPSVQLGERLSASPDYEVDGRRFQRIGFSSSLSCEACGIDYPKPDPQLFNFNSPLGACPTCEGFGNLIDLDMNLIIPDDRKSIQDGAIAPWNTPAYAHELEELLALAADYDLPTEIPYRELSEANRELIRKGVPEREFGGLEGFFAWLERRKYKMHLRVFLSRWRSARPCPDCQGARFRPETLSIRIGPSNIAEISAMKIQDALAYVQSLTLTEREMAVGRMMLEQVRARLHFLNSVGLGYLSLDRALRTLSGGETQRVALTSALGSALVNMLYVLDEPSVGLHPKDTGRLFDVIRQLRDRGNSVIVVEHEEQFLREADQVVETGPGAGDNGGQVMFQGTPEQMLEPGVSLTGDYLTGRRGASSYETRRETCHGRIRLRGARGNNLKNIDVEFPLGVLSVVSGVSGAGKSTLVQDTLYPAVCQRKRKDCENALPYNDVLGDGQIDDVVLVDQSPIGRSPRSNPVTYIKAFDAIRAVFADTLEARTHNYTAGHFSFNVEGGRCSACEGDGFVQIDMQFLADVYMKCSQCQGKRYRKEILDVTYRDKNIADVLDMSVRKAFGFFRGQDKVQKRLKRLMDVGLDYLKLGQPANTLSAGEAQRLKLAGYLASAKRQRTLFLLDEPTTGLHFSDIVKLLDCFDALLSVGHSLIVVEHNLQIMKAADHIIDLGPGAADEGGQVVAEGTPEQLADDPNSVTGRYLKESMAADRRAIEAAEQEGEDD